MPIEIAPNDLPNNPHKDVPIPGVDKKEFCNAVDTLRFTSQRFYELLWDMASTAGKDRLAFADELVALVDRRVETDRMKEGD